MRKKNRKPTSSNPEGEKPPAEKGEKAAPAEEGEKKEAPEKGKSSTKMARVSSLGCEQMTGKQHVPSHKLKEYRVTNRLQEGKRPLYAVVFNFMDSRYLNRSEE